MDEKNKYETEIDFLSLPKQPSRLFGWIFPYYLILFLITGIYFVKNMDSASQNLIKSNYTDSLDVNVNVPVKKGGIMPAIDLSIITDPTGNIIEQGKTLFSTNCASCHGNEGRGNGVAAAALNPPPRDFYSVEGWKNGRDFNGMYRTLQEGIAGGGMIAYDFLSVEDRIAIIHYIRSLTDFPEITEESVAQLDQNWELSKGVVSPNNITLEMAESFISSEANDLPFDVKTVIQNIESSDDKDAVNLFNKITSDKEKAVRLFGRDFAGKENPDIFINSIIVYPNQNGFKASVSLLTSEQLNDIFNLLSRSFS
jgi:hypothetical protein